VQDVDGASAELDRARSGIAGRPVGSVHIALDRDHGRDAAQARDDLGTADVAGVDDMRNAGEALLRLGAQQAVRIRNHSYLHRHQRPCLAGRGSLPDKSSAKLSPPRQSYHVADGDPGPALLLAKLARMQGFVDRRPAVGEGKLGVGDRVVFCPRSDGECGERDGEHDSREAH